MLPRPYSQTVRYLAAHTFVVNLDSYSSSMQQNYYIYEREGVLSILPWDYNLAFGGFQSGDASAVVNFPIDTPVSGVTMEDRPLISVLLAVDEYRERYHGYLNDIVEGYVNGGLFEEEVDRIDAEIGEYVKTDATAYYTYNEYQTAVEALKTVVGLRAESVAGQLSGSIPSTTEGQSENPESLLDVGDFSLSSLGSMGGGRGGGGFGDRQTTAAAGGEAEDSGEITPGEGGAPPDDGGGMASGGGTADAGGATADTGGGMPTMGEGMPDMATISEIMAALQEGGELTAEQQAQLEEMGLSAEDIERFSEMAQGGGMFGGGGGFPGGNTGGGEGGQGGMPGMSGGAAGGTAAGLTMADWAMYAVLGAALLAGILVLAFYSRRKWVRTR